MTLLIIPPPHFRKQTSLINEIGNVGQSANLQACIDVSDVRCYPGSGQTVTDLAGVNNFFLGRTTGSEATFDPTFVGTAGKETSGEYFRCPDFAYTISSSPNSFSNGMHANNALFTLVGWTRTAATDLPNGNGFVTTSGPGDTGGAIFLGSSSNDTGFGGKFGLGVLNSTTTALNINTGLTPPAASIFFYGFSFDEAAGTWAAQINGSQASGSGATYSSPEAAGGISLGLRWDQSGDPSGGYSGDIFAGAAWSRKLSAAEIDSIFQASRNKYGV